MQLERLLANRLEILELLAILLEHLVHRSFADVDALALLQPAEDVRKHPTTTLEDLRVLANASLSKLILDIMNQENPVLVCSLRLLHHLLSRLVA